MITVLTKVLRRLFVAAGDVCNSSNMEAWTSDPLAHPALKRMSQAELGDLPWGTAWYRVCKAAE